MFRIFFFQSRRRLHIDRVGLSPTVSATYEVSRILRHQFVDVLSTNDRLRWHVADRLTSFEMAEVGHRMPRMVSGLD